jgi:hypothetical protein
VVAAAGQGWFAALRGNYNLASSLWSGFDIAPPVVIAYTLFALVLGVAAGAAIRRTVPAMAATLVGFIVVRVAVLLLARPTYLTPLTQRGTFSGQGGWAFQGVPPSWQVSWGFVNAAGHTVTLNQALPACSGAATGLTPCPGISALMQYQPVSRFWLFQGIEAAIFLVLAVALLALAYRLVMRMR